MNKNNNILLTFLAGAAAGAAIGYFIAGGKADDIKSGIDNLKEEFEKNVARGKEIISKIRDMATNEEEETPTVNGSK